ncbi:unnamed protein product [Closterium sp. NIES-54]
METQERSGSGKEKSKSGKSKAGGSGAGAAMEEVDKDVSSFLVKMERGGMIQSFGCVLLVEEGTFRLLAYSDNVPEVLCLPQKSSAGTYYINAYAR